VGTRDHLPPVTMRLLPQGETLMRSRPNRQGPPATRHTAWIRITTAAASAAMLSTLGLAGTTAWHAQASAASTAGMKLVGDTASCHLGNGVQHVVQLTFDNVHFFRDNPDVPSDLEQLPNLLNFFENNGTFLSNNHTPLIAHTADDILTTYSGLYGDRQGDGISNSYQSYNRNGPNGTFGTTDLDTAFTYWTDPIADEHTPSTGSDTSPNMVYAPVPPATAVHTVSPTSTPPAPWVPFTRAGCNVGDVATANQELESTSPDMADAFGANSPEVAQLNADPDSFKDPETADYIGIAVHCAQGNAFCSSATAIKYNQTTPSPTAVTDSLPDEPNGYTGYQVLFGHKYVAPQLGAGTPNVMRDGHEITNAAGNLVDLNGNEIDGAFLSPPAPGFPGFSSINASQTLAYMADMLESGVPVVNGYISDLHGNEFIGSLSSPPSATQPAGGPCYQAPDALGSGSACYVAQAAYYNQAFGTFFQRLAADGITPQNTLFILSSDEGDHEAGANVGRAIQPTPVGCNGVSVACTYPNGSFGELDGNLTGLLAQEKSNTTAFGLEEDTAPEYYINGDPGPDAAVTRTFEHAVAGLTAFNPYTGQNQLIANYLADPTEEAILHFVNADPARTPTLAEFAKPDYFLTPGKATCDDTVTGVAGNTAGCVNQSSGFAWDHGDYAAEINSNYVGFVGPGVKNLGLNGWGPTQGPDSSGPNSGQSVVIQENNPGTWTDETDIRPTEMYLLGLKDDYEHDGRVITQILSNPNSALAAPGVAQLGACYKQLNSSVGQFGAYTLQADTTAIESSTPGDFEYLSTDRRLAGLEKIRDAVALRLKAELDAAAFQDTPIFAPALQTFVCQGVITSAHLLTIHF
jgi:hypothetical protein